MISSIHSHSPSSGLQIPMVHRSVGAQDNQRASQQISEDEKKIRELKKRDAEVRRHEQAHKAAAGRFAMGAAQYQYVIGPDGRRYAVSGEVQIDSAEIPNDQAATIRKAQVIKRAALAPKDPSSQDRSVAAEASRMEAKARRELLEQKQENNPYGSDGKTNPGKPESFLNLLI